VWCGVLWCKHIKFEHVRTIEQQHSFLPTFFPTFRSVFKINHKFVWQKGKMLCLLMFGFASSQPPAGSCFFSGSIVMGKFCGTLTDPNGGAGTSYHPHLNVMINCPHPPSQYTDLPATFYGTCTDGSPDYCNSPVSCLGELRSFNGGTSKFEKAAELSKGNDKCFANGEAQMGIIGNSTGLTVSSKFCLLHCFAEKHLSLSS
jgi:hypothetical protein